MNNHPGEGVQSIKNEWLTVTGLSTHFKRSSSGIALLSLCNSSASVAFPSRLSTRTTEKEDKDRIGRKIDHASSQTHWKLLNRAMPKSTQRPRTWHLGSFPHEWLLRLSGNAQVSLIHPTSCYLPSPDASLQWACSCAAVWAFPYQSHTPLSPLQLQGNLNTTATLTRELPQMFRPGVREYTQKHQLANSQQSCELVVKQTHTHIHTHRVIVKTYVGDGHCGTVDEAIAWDTIQGCLG